MPDRTILRKTLRDLRWQIVGWGLGLATLAALLVLLFPVFAEQFEGVDLENLGFGEVEDFSDPRQFLQLEFFTWSPVLLTVFSIIAGGALLAGEEGRGTLELLLSQPLARRGLFLGKLAGAAIAVVAILLVTGLGFLISGQFVDLEGKVTPGELAIAPFVLLPFVSFSIAVTMLVATLTPTRGRAAGLMILGAAASYVLNIIAGVADSLAWLRFLSPYYYTDAQQVLTEGPVWQHQALLFVAAVVCALLALAAFERREIGVGRSPLAALLGRERTAEGAAGAASEAHPARQS